MLPFTSGFYILHSKLACYAPSPLWQDELYVLGARNATPLHNPADGRVYLPGHRKHPASLIFLEDVRIQTSTTHNAASRGAKHHVLMVAQRARLYNELRLIFPTGLLLCANISAVPKQELGGREYAHVGPARLQQGMGPAAGGNGLSQRKTARHI